jgi:hypothetical protein
MSGDDWQQKERAIKHPEATIALQRHHLGNLFVQGHLNVPLEQNAPVKNNKEDGKCGPMRNKQRRTQRDQLAISPTLQPPKSQKYSREDIVEKIEPRRQGRKDIQSRETTEPRRGIDKDSTVRVRVRV